MAGDTLSVRAKTGVVMPRMAPHGGFCGYELVHDPSAHADHEIPGGPRYRRKDVPESVPNNAYYRRALSRGDLLASTIQSESASFESEV